MDESSKTVEKGEHTSIASLEYTLVLISVAVPQLKRPPPCKPKERARDIPSGRWNVTHEFDSWQSSHPAKMHVEQLSVFQWGHGGTV